MSTETPASTAQTTGPVTEASPPDSYPGSVNGNNVWKDGKTPVNIVEGANQDLSKSSFLFNYLIPLLLLAIGAATVAALGTVAPVTLPPPDLSDRGIVQSFPSVEVHRVQSLAETGRKLHLETDGTVVPFREATLATEVAGKIVFKSPLCEAGTFVSKDELLVRIDDTDYKLEVERLTRQKEQAYEQIRELDQEMVNVRRQLDVAKQDVELQQKEVQRLSSLPRGFASSKEMDQAQRAVLQATQQQVSYDNNLELLSKRRVRLEASERLAATQLRSAEVNLERTQIRAPIDGVIVREDAELNTFVARGNPIVTIEDTSKAEVAVKLRVDQLYWIMQQSDDGGDHSAAGYQLPETPASIEYEVAGRGGTTVYRWAGRLLGYDGIGLDTQTRTVPVRIVVDEPNKYRDPANRTQETPADLALVRGMFVRVRLEIETQASLVVLPARALKPGNRIWQFAAENDVIQDVRDRESQKQRQVTEGDTEKSPPTKETVESNASNPANSESSEATDDSFDLAEWVPGLVTIQENVIPIDALTIDNGNGSPGDADDPSARLWICEVPEGSLPEDSYVVLSPLGSVPVEGLAARAATGQISRAAGQFGSPPVRTGMDTP
ncbi:MAG: HlyD family efflux transporter periplasmic adaptor subunit [Planctomycetota bacterium]